MGDYAFSVMDQHVKEEDFVHVKATITYWPQKLLT